MPHLAPRINFIALVKMMIAPIGFCTVAHGIASAGDLKKLGRVGGKTLLYIEIVSTLALVSGLLAVNTLQSGKGLHERAPALKDHTPPAGMSIRQTSGHPYCHHTH